MNLAKPLPDGMQGKPLLRGVSFKLEARDRMTLSGRNGAGKTTLLRMLAGQASVDFGELVFAKGAKVALHDQRPPRAEVLLALQPGDGVSVGFITYPSPISKKFSFSQKPLAVYESEAAIKVMLKAAGSAPKGVHSFAAKLSVQACDDQVCYAPGTIDLSVPVTVK